MFKYLFCFLLTAVLLKNVLALRCYGIDFKEFSRSDDGLFQVKQKLANCSHWLKEMFGPLEIMGQGQVNSQCFTAVAQGDVIKIEFKGCVPSKGGCTAFEQDLGKHPNFKNFPKISCYECSTDGCNKESKLIEKAECNSSGKSYLKFASLVLVAIIFAL